MNISITFKHPDALEYALEDIEDEETRQELHEKLKNKFFKYGEYVTIDIDTDTIEATVRTL